MWGTVDKPLMAVPGDKDATLTIVFQNLRAPSPDRTEFTMCGVNVVLEGDPSQEFPFRREDGTRVARSYYNGEIRLGQSGTVRFRLDIDEDAKPGEYVAVATFTYRECGSQEKGTFPRDQSSVPVKIKVWEPPEISVLNVFWEDEGKLSTAGPGDRALTLVLTLRNPRYNTMANINGVLKLSYPFTSTASGERAESFHSGLVESGETATMKFVLNIESGARIGIYSLPLTLEYYNHWQTRKLQTLSAQIKLEGSENIVVSAKPMTLPSGSAGKLAAVITNEGTAPVYSLKASFSLSTSSLSTVSGENLEVDELKPEGKVTVEPTILAPPSVPEAAYQGSLRVEYKDINGVKHTADYRMNIIVSNLAVAGLEATILGNPVTASKLSQLEVRVTNLNDEEIRDVKLSIDTTGLPLAIVGGDRQKFISEIPSRGQASLAPRIMVSPSAQEVIYQATLTASYKDSRGVSRTESIKLPIVVQGSIEIVFRSVQFSENPAQAGRTVSIVGEILNKGTSAARLSEAYLELERPLSSTPESRYYIGDIDPNSLTTFTLSFTVERTAGNRSSNLSLVITYENAYGISSKATKSLTLETVTTLPQRATGAAAQAGQTAIRVPGQFPQPTQTPLGFLTPYLTIIAIAALISTAILGVALVLTRRKLSRLRSGVAK